MKKNIFKNTVKPFIMFCSIILLLCSFQISWKIIDKKEYSLECPNDWKALDINLPNTEFSLSAPPKKGEENKFATSINLIIKDLKGKNIDLKKFIETAKAQIPFMLEKGVVLESKPLGSGHAIIYKGKYGDFDVKYKQVTWVKNEKAFVLTFATDELFFSSYITTIEKIFNSFKLKI